MILLLSCMKQRRTPYANKKFSWKSRWICLNVNSSFVWIIILVASMEEKILLLQCKIDAQSSRIMYKEEQAIKGKMRVYYRQISSFSKLLWELAVQAREENNRLYKMGRSWCKDDIISKGKENNDNMHELMCWVKETRKKTRLIRVMVYVLESWERRLNWSRI